MVAIFDVPGIEYLCEWCGRKFDDINDFQNHRVDSCRVIEETAAIPNSQGLNALLTAMNGTKVKLIF